jgi:vacuolar-type H+-ATPase subunit H
MLRIDDRTVLQATASMKGSKIMAKYKDTVSEATDELSASVRKENRAIAESVMEAGERNIKFAQGSFEHEVELLRSHAKSTRALTDKLVGESEKGEPLFEFVTQSVVAAGDRNVKFVQGFLQDGTELLESHVEGTRTLMNTLTEESRKQREALGVLVRGTWDAYRGIFPSPLGYYERVVDTVESIAKRGVDTVESIAKREADTAEKTEIVFVDDMALDEAHQEKPAAHAAKK